MTLQPSPVSDKTLQPVSTCLMLSSLPSSTQLDSYSLPIGNCWIFPSFTLPSLCKRSQVVLRVDEDPWLNTYLVQCCHWTQWWRETQKHHPLLKSTKRGFTAVMENCLWCLWAGDICTWGLDRKAWEDDSFLSHWSTSLPQGEKIIPFGVKRYGLHIGSAAHGLNILKQVTFLIDFIFSFIKWGGYIVWAPQSPKL